ncbi:heme exporter protein CcmD [Rhizobium sp. CC-YZS058]|uniref:heme exporter protein CcmD n=1 Tax=Rhizobium sp. CC-YZS058 TaxID=3042153 RepID=UPI002B05FE29|nr:heme exporter protein CcmD [Rhizobium sp. CC-YZS058]MEA3536609.1 heme exporter protein CcmD [Rhizobium sp. CC-YZS058]
MTAHLVYVALSYGAALIIVIGLIAWVTLDGRARRRELAALEAAGIRRRSSGAKP